VKSFKTKIRSTSEPQYWRYNLTALESNIRWWEVWFACGNTSELADLFITLENTDENPIAKLKYEYLPEGTSPPTDYVLALYYWHPTQGWTQLSTDLPGGYLFNDWYKLRIEKNDTNLDYSLYRTGQGQVAFETAGQLSAPFSGLKQAEWSSTMDPVVCPMFFWDEHKLGLIPVS
jgi:hypothetical protein